jgi:DNA-binding NarL/FixJ family response regulator
MTHDRPRVLLADDHRAILDYLCELLAADFDVVGMVGDGQSVLTATAELEPEVVVLDISMPVLSGLEAAVHLAGVPRPPRVVFLTVHEDAEFLEAAMSAGALGYVVKRRMGSDIAAAIRDALAGRMFVSPSLRADFQPEASSFPAGSGGPRF